MAGAGVTHVSFTFCWYANIPALQLCGLCGLRGPNRSACEQVRQHQHTARTAASPATAGTTVRAGGPPEGLLQHAAVERARQPRRPRKQRAHSATLQLRLLFVALQLDRLWLMLTCVIVVHRSTCSSSARPQPLTPARRHARAAPPRTAPHGSGTRMMRQTGMATATSARTGSGCLCRHGTTSPGGSTIRFIPPRLHQRLGQIHVCGPRC